MNDTTAADATGPTSTAAHLLAVAGIVPSETELARFARIHPVLRAQADALYAPEFGAEDFALGFLPALGWS